MKRRPLSGGKDDKKPYIHMQLLIAAIKDIIGITSSMYPQFFRPMLKS